MKKYICKSKFREGYLYIYSALKKNSANFRREEFSISACCSSLSSIQDHTAYQNRFLIYMFLKNILDN
jgi:hypothetical protein